MNEVIKAMKERRSIRKFKPDMPPAELIDQIMEAGLYAASAMGKQSPIMIAVTNKELRNMIAADNCRIGGWEEGFDTFYGAPAFIIVLAPKDWPHRVYDGSLAVAYILTPNGQLTRNPSTGTYTSQYNIPDHLGNVRSVVSSSGTVLQSTDYYPFGLRMAGGTQATGNRWRFAGKEEQKEGISLDWLNFGARMYDPYLARWTTQDPLAEKYYNISPYAYCAGDPVNMIDPNGKDWVYDQEMQQYIWRDDVDSIDNTPTGLEYVGKDNASILQHLGFGTPIRTQGFDSSGLIFNDFDFIHRVSVQGESVIYVQANSTYSEEAQSETNRYGRLFTGLSVVANEIIDIVSTAEDTEAYFQMDVLYNGEHFDSQLQTPNGPVIASRGTIKSAVVTIPSSFVKNAHLFHYAGMTVSLSGMFGVKSYLGFSPMVSLSRPLMVEKVRQSFSF